MKTELEIYLTAKALLATKEQWTQGNYAVRADQEGVDLDDPEACAFCLHGALLKAANPIPNPVSPYTIYNTIYDVIEKQIYNTIYDVVGKQFGRCNLATFNDAKETTYEDVIRVLDEAIAKVTV
jgi:hypothetical protein